MVKAWLFLSINNRKGNNRDVSGNCRLIVAKLCPAAPIRRLEKLKELMPGAPDQQKHDNNRVSTAHSEHLPTLEKSSH